MGPWPGEFQTYTNREPKKFGIDAMGTQAIRDKLQAVGRPHQGSRQIVIKRHKDHISQRGEPEVGTGEGEESDMVALASENP